MSLGPFTPNPVVPANHPTPAPPPLPFPYATAFMQNPVAIINGMTYPENPLEYATPLTAVQLATITGAQIQVESEGSPGTTFASPQYMLLYTPPADPNGQSPAPAPQIINAGLLADSCNKWGFTKDDAVWRSLPSWTFGVVGAQWQAALKALLG